LRPLRDGNSVDAELAFGRDVVIGGSSGSGSNATAAGKADMNVVGSLLSMATTETSATSSLAGGS